MIQRQGLNSNFGQVKNTINCLHKRLTRDDCPQIAAFLFSLFQRLETTIVSKFNSNSRFDQANNRGGNALQKCSRSLRDEKKDRIKIRKIIDTGQFGLLCSIMNCSTHINLKNTLQLTLLQDSFRASTSATSERTTAAPKMSARSVGNNLMG